MLDLNPIAPNINPVKTIIVTFLGDRKSQPFSITIPNWISTGATVGTWHGCWRKMYSPPHRILTCPLNRDHFKRKVSGAMLAECFSKWWLVMRSVWVVLWRLCATTWTCFTIESLQLWTNSKLHETAKSTCQGFTLSPKKGRLFKKNRSSFRINFQVRTFGHFKDWEKSNLRSRQLLHLECHPQHQGPQIVTQTGILRRGIWVAC